MPVKFGNKFVVSLHRPDLLKKLRPGDKEQLEQTVLQPFELPARKSKALVQFSRVTPYNRFASVDAVNAAVRGIAQADAPQQLMQQVRAHIEHHRRTRGEPGLILLGEAHGASSALALVLTALHSGARVHGTKKLMFERPPQQIAHRFPTPDPGQARFDKKVRTDQPLRYRTTDSEETNLFSTGLYAKHLGYEVHGFDSLFRGAPNQETRENAMVGALAGALTGSALTIVVAGSHHVPELHEKLGPQVNTVAMATVLPVPRGDTDLTKRTSYLLSTPEVLKISPGHALESAPLEPIHFINHVLP